MPAKGSLTPLEKSLGLDTFSEVSDTLVAGHPEPFELIEHGGRYTLIVHNGPDAIGIDNIVVNFKSGPSAALGSFKSETARQQIARHLADDIRLIMKPFESARDVNTFALIITEIRMMTEHFLKRVGLSLGKTFTR